MNRTLTAVVLAFFAGASYADVAPGPPLTKDQVRRQNGVDDCKERRPGDPCIDMKGAPGTCGWFTWWWVPGTNDRKAEGGDLAFAAHVTHCDTIQRKGVQAFKCLVCK